MKASTTAVFPVVLPQFVFEAFTDTDDAPFDPFGGSGTTMIAAEKSGRCARLMERDPKLCDVVIRRGQERRGKKAARESDGVAFDALVSEPGGLEHLLLTRILRVWVVMLFSWVWLVATPV